MPRRSQEAEDEAYAKALQDEYRREFIRRQVELDRSENGTALAAMEGDRSRTTTTSNDESTKKKKSKKKKSKSRSNNRSRSSSRDSMDAANSRDKRSRRRRRSRSGRDMDGDEWISTYYPDQQAPPASSAPMVVPLPPPPFVEDSSSHPDWGDQAADDEEYARRIQQELNDAEFAQHISECEKQDDRHRSESRSQGRSVQQVPRLFAAYNSNNNNTKDSLSSGGSTEPLTDDDEAVARRIQQELADAEYAQRISTLERENAASREVVLSLERQNQIQQQQIAALQQPRRKSCLAKWLPLVLCLAVAITIPLLYVFDVFNPSDIPFLGDLFQDDWVGGDSNMTFSSINGTNIPRLPDNAMGWANTGNGLRLDVLNACSDEWQEFVQKALDNWDDGSPIDSLTLYQSRVNFEYECEVVTGKLKICNGNYGDTRWRGLNEVLLSPRQNTIVASTAKLNEFYLNYESDAQKLYTACHELGHGFGLPHWDEDFFNKDLGNCMDYTQTPHKSSAPDESNFWYLAQLYGGLDVRTNTEITAAEASIMAFEKSGAKGENMVVRNLLGSRRSLRSGAGIPLSESRLVIDDSLPGGNSPTRRILHATESAEVHATESTNFPGHVLLQHFLLTGDEIR